MKVCRFVLFPFTPNILYSLHMSLFGSEKLHKCIQCFQSSKFSYLIGENCEFKLFTDNLPSIRAIKSNIYLHITPIYVAGLT